MTLASSLLNGIGAILMIHAVYSSYEHSLFVDASSNATSTTIPGLQHLLSLPVDIIAETLVSMTLLCAGVVLSASQLKPIHMNDWAGRLERSKEARKIKAFGDGGGNPYARLEERPGFMQVRPAKQTKI